MKWYDYPVCIYIAIQIWINLITLNLIGMAISCIMFVIYERWRSNGNSWND